MFSCTLKICLFGQNTKQPLSNFEPYRNLENTSNFEDWDLTIVAYKKIVSQKNF